MVRAIRIGYTLGHVSMHRRQNDHHASLIKQRPPNDALGGRCFWLSVPWTYSAAGCRTSTTRRLPGMQKPVDDGAAVLIVIPAVSHDVPCFVCLRYEN